MIKLRKAVDATAYWLSVTDHLPRHERIAHILLILLVNNSANVELCNEFGLSEINIETEAISTPEKLATITQLLALRNAIVSSPHFDRDEKGSKFALNEFRNLTIDIRRIMAGVGDLSPGLAEDIYRQLGGILDSALEIGSFAERSDLSRYLRTKKTEAARDKLGARPNLKKDIVRRLVPQIVEKAPGSSVEDIVTALKRIDRNNFHSQNQTRTKAYVEAVLKEMRADG